MFGCGCNRNNSGCTILLIIIILAWQGLLDGGPRSRTAITLLLLWWLCGFGGNFGFGNQQCCGNNAGYAPLTTYAPALSYAAPAASYAAPANTGCCCSGCSYQTNCCTTCCCRPKEKRCKCKRVKVCKNNCCC